jgi:O-antigen/teichoic acid export membrane protein
LAPRKLIRDTAGLAASQYVSRLVQLLRGVVAASLVGPSLYGSWNALLLILDYGTLAPLGMQQGLDQEIPGSLTRGRPEETHRLKIAGFSGMIVLWALYALGVVVYLLARPRRLEVNWGLGGPLLMLVAVLLQHGIWYHLTLLRSHGRMGVVSKSLSLQAIVGGVASLLLIFPFGLWGLLYGWLVGQAVTLVYVRQVGRDVVPLGFRIDRATGLLLARGFPIFIFLASQLVLKTLDRIMILKFLSTEALGYYSVGIMAVSLLLYLPESISFVLYPRLIARFRGGADAHTTAQDIVRPMALVAWFMPLVVGVAYAVLDLVVPLILPRFAPGVPAMDALLWGALGLGLASVPAYYLMAIGKQDRLVPIAVAIVLIQGSAILAFLSAGHGILGVAIAVSVSYGVFGLSLLTYAAAQLAAPWSQRARFVARFALPSLWALALSLALHRFVAPLFAVLSNRWLEALLLALLFGAIYLATARWVGPRTGIVALMRDSHWPLARTLAGAWARE